MSEMGFYQHLSNVLSTEKSCKMMINEIVKHCYLIIAKLDEFSVVF